MKFICTADIHLKRWDDKKFTDSGIPLRLEEILNAFENMCKYALENGISNIKIAGDINHLKNVVHVDAFVLFQKLLENYTGIFFDILHGNHDSAPGTDIRSAIELFKGIPNVRVITEELREEGISYIPFSNNMVEQIDNSEPNKILISHMGLGDAQLSSGASIKERIGSNNLRKFDLVLLGHYHKPQQLNHVYYVGSPIQMRRDEAGEEKRFLVVDTETLKVESIPTTGYRTYHELIIEKQEDVETIVEQAKVLQSEGNYVRVRRKTQDKISVPKDIVIIDDYQEEYQNRGLTTSMALTEQMKKYLEISRIPEAEWQEYIDVFLEGMAG